MNIIILCGGLGTRLGITTTVINKHLLPGGDGKPIVSNSLDIVLKSKSDECLIVTNPSSMGQFAVLFESEVEPFSSINAYFTSQKEPLGIGDAIGCGSGYCREGPTAVILGDNKFSDTDIESIAETIRLCKNRDDFGCHIWCAVSSNPQEYGVIKFDSYWMEEVVDVIEKPKDPPSNIIMTGVYLFDSKLWDILRGLKPSSRGEYEVTDIIRQYINDRELAYHMLSGDWVDMGQSMSQYLGEISNEVTDNRCKRVYR